MADCLDLVDLHVHTTVSDGTESPHDVVHSAKEIGLRAIAIADHDTVDGLAEAQQEAALVKIEFLPAVEINCDLGTHEVHILGYFVDPRDARLIEKLETLRESRIARARKILTKLEGLGLALDFEHVKRIAGSGSLGRPHIARAMREKGYTRSSQDAFDRYLNRGRPAHVERLNMTPFEAVEFLRSVGSLPVWAHPGLSRRDDLLPRLLEKGLAGLEAYHCDHTPKQTRHYLRLARKYDLLVTGGSDSHGPLSERPVRIGDVKVPYEVVERLKEYKARLACGT